MTTDHVGSARVVTGAQSAGRVPVLARYDYQPFGYFIPTTFPSGRSSFPEYAGNDDTTQKFTSKQRDQESSLDYFGFRYYASYQGRWTGTDPKQDLEANAAEPQTWNLYQYVRNAPLTRVDQDGRQEGTEESVLRMEMIKRGWTDQQIEQYFKEYRQGQIEGLKRGAVMAPLGVPALLDLLGRTYEFIGGAGHLSIGLSRVSSFLTRS